MHKEMQERPSLDNISFRAIAGGDDRDYRRNRGWKIIDRKTRSLGFMTRRKEEKLKVFGHDVREYEVESLRGHISVVIKKRCFLKGRLRRRIFGGEMNMHRNEHWKKRLKFSQAKSSLIQSGKLEFMIEQNGGGICPAGRGV